mmetsp:Transcript_14237/g.21719  ORF Transcript_14237/g.21719 Transcript_14237/m.21719 type:complete len:216 (+) Transcript_14237:183-830(+)
MAPLQLMIRNRRYLPAGYSPRQHDVICESKLRARLHNERFRSTIRLHLKLYLDASDKNYVIEKIIDNIRQQSIGGGFIKQDRASGLYFEVGDFHARQEIIRAFKEAEKNTLSNQNVSDTIIEDDLSVPSELAPLTRLEETSPEDEKEIAALSRASSWAHASFIVNKTSSNHFHPSDFCMKRCNRDLLNDDEEEISLVESFFDISRRKSTLTVVSE